MASPGAPIVPLPPAPVQGAWLSSSGSSAWAAASSTRISAANPADGRPSSESSWLPGLDGLRAVAVAAVLLFHGDLGIAPGGFLGVDVFFVISGFLITTLLLREHAAHGRIDLLAFWRRRARRLLPALFFLLMLVVAFAAAFVPDALANLRIDVLAALGYVTNWYLIVDQQSYFEAIGRPSLLRHLWSLAVEEQFYLVWPVVLVVALSLVRRWGAALLALLVVLASIAWTAILFDPDGDPSRVYYGTDTRAFGLLIGALVAFAWTARRGPTLQRLTGRLTGFTTRVHVGDVVAVAGLAGLVWAFATVDEYDPFLDPWGAAIVAVVAAATIGAAIQPTGWVGRRVLDFAPLRWIGRRSYAIYLWHWPIFTVTRPSLDVPLTPTADFVLRVGATLVLAELSWLLIEEPIRRGAHARVRPRLRGLVHGSAWARAGGLAAAATLVVAVAAVSARVITSVPATSADGVPEASLQAVVGESPAPSDAAVVIPDPSGASDPADPSADLADPSEAPSADPSAAPADPSEEPSADPSSSPGVDTSAAPSEMPSAPAAPSTSVSASSDPISSPSASASVPSTVPATAVPATRAPTPRPTHPPVTPAPTPTPPPLNANVYAIGDSVLLGAARELGRALGRVEVDAVVGRQMSTGLAILHQRRADGRLPDVVVVHLGDNGPITTAQVKDLFDTLSAVPHVAVLTIRIPDDFEDHNNKLISQLARDYPNVILVDWHAAANDKPQLFWNDGEHLRPEGADFYAGLIASALRDHGVSTN